MTAYERALRSCAQLQKKRVIRIGEFTIVPTDTGREPFAAVNPRGYVALKGYAFDLVYFAMRESELIGDRYWDTVRRSAR